MNQITLEKAREIFQKTAEEMGLQLVSCKYIPNGIDGPVLEVLIDKDFNISLDEIGAYTERVNPLLDEIDDSEEGYTLEISSGGSEREIPFSMLPSLLGKWLDIKLKKSGEVIAMMLDEFSDEKATLHYFIKGRKKKEVLTAEDVESIHMGYKA